MEIDKTTLQDLGIFNSEDEISIFHRLDFTRTSGGRERLRINFNQPLNDIVSITGIQETIKLIHDKIDSWPLEITNGTLMVIQKYFEATIDDIPAHPNATAAYSYKMFHGPDFSLVKYSLSHAFDLVKGMQALIDSYFTINCPLPFKTLLSRVDKIISKEQFNVVRQRKKYDELTKSEMLTLAYFIRYTYKQSFQELQEIYDQFDAWYSIAIAIQKYNLVFPEFIEDAEPTIQTTGLYHILLSDAVAYDITLDKQCNFLFLTGANMAGKSTFIKSVGAAVFLAHLGMPVPVKTMELTLFDGLLSN